MGLEHAPSRNCKNSERKGSVAQAAEEASRAAGCRRLPTARWVTQPQPTSPKSQANLDDQTMASCPHHKCVATHRVFILMRHISREGEANGTKHESYKRNAHKHRSLV